MIYFGSNLTDKKIKWRQLPVERRSLEGAQRHENSTSDEGLVRRRLYLLRGMSMLIIDTKWVCFCKII